MEERPEDSSSSEDKMKNLLSKKKAQLETLTPAILALVFAAIVLVFGLVITQELRDTNVVTTAESGSIVNESAPFNTSSSVTLLADTYPAGACGTITQVRNGTVGKLINSGNYSQSGCVVTNTTNAYATEDWKIDYSYTRGGEAYVSANETIAGLGTFADFWEIIVLAIIISIVIGLLLVMFGKQARR